MRTPARAPLVLPTRRLAEAIAEEWEAQGEKLKPAEMHRTQIAATAIDRIGPNRDKVISDIAAYATTDLLCYRAEQPRPLVERQHAVWQPLLDWAAITFDAPLAVTHGVVPIRQPEAAVEALRHIATAQDNLRLAALHVATTLLGSVVLGLALLWRRIDAEEAFRASVLDEDFQVERWGEDAEAARRRAALRAELGAVEDFLKRLND